MEQKEISISGLYYRYKKNSDEEIREHLKRIAIVVLKDNGVGSIYEYYPLSDASMEKILEKPRNVSLSFDATETSDTPITGLKELKTIKYLVKSSSRFFLKPDVGEIFDQISYRDIQDVKAIVYSSNNYETLPDTDGEHHILEATLLF